MTVLSLLAASFTFTATATGVEKGVPIEFPFVGKGSDRDYESLFVLDGSVDDLCKGIEAAGCPRGRPVDTRECVVWPVGCKVSISPALETYLDSNLSDGSQLAPLIYTGGKRTPDGRCDAATNMPLSAFSVYSLPQSPLVYAVPYEQGNVYNCHLAKSKIEKGTRVSFTLTWGADSRPTALQLLVRPGKATEVVMSLKSAAEKGEVDALIDFDESLTVAEAKSVAEALAVVDSPRVKINGRRPGRLYYRAFLPLTKWLDRQERLVQPFEFTIGQTNRIVHIDEDWSVEGPDPKLTPRDISFDEVKSFPNTDTCLVFAKSLTTLKDIYSIVADTRLTQIKTWYVYVLD